MVYDVIISILNNNICLNFRLLMFFAHTFNVILDEIIKRREKRNETKSSIYIPKSFFISFFLVIFILILIFIFLGSDIGWITLFIFNAAFVFYALIFCPLFNLRLLYDFKDSSTIVTSMLLTEYYGITTTIEYSSLNKIFDGVSLQILTIIIVALIFLLLSYFILLSSYNIIKNIKTIIKNLMKKNHSITDKTYTNEVFYVLSKISLIFSLFSTYCIIVSIEYFSSPIVSIFELIISTIIIPIILEMLLSRKQ